MNPNQSNYYAVIPACVRYCKDLEPNAKLLYGEITALCNQEGYCWATSAYFSNLYDVDVRTIRRWLSSLEKQKFISIHIDRVGIQTTRRIYISNEHIKINNTVGQKCPSKPDKILRVQGNIVHHNNTSNNTREKQQQEPIGSVAVFSELLRETGLTDKDKKSIIAYVIKNKFTEEDLKRAIDFAFHPDTEIKTTHIKTIMWALKEKPEVPKPVDERANIKYAEAAECILYSDNWILEANSQCVLVYSKSPYNKKNYELPYRSQNFKEKLEKILKECGFKNHPKQ